MFFLIIYLGRLLLIVCKWKINKNNGSQQLTAYLVYYYFGNNWVVNISKISTEIHTKCIFFYHLWNPKNSETSLAIYIFKICSFLRYLFLLKDCNTAISNLYFKEKWLPGICIKNSYYYKDMLVIFLYCALLSW